MPNPFFRFKQFVVYHDQCAMKVGTDGVLLGAWADCTNVQTILDIGTGSGLISLMLAQRSDARKIDAIDIDEGAYRQAILNFKSSPWSDRLNVYHTSLQDFTSSYKYDLIACNPPYFVNSLKSPDDSRSNARHNDSLSFPDLIAKARNLLSPIGKLTLILPSDRQSDIEALAGDNGLYASRITAVCPTLGSSSKRILIEYSLFEKEALESELVIERARHVYTHEYKSLTKEFYLDK